MKPLPTALKRLRGTERKDRAPVAIRIAAPSDLPVRPEWLTPAGEEAWANELGRASSVGFATELDSALFGSFCNLLGAADLIWRRGEVPPVAHLAEIRKLAELFGLAGERSRVGRTQGPPSISPADEFLA